MAVNLEEFYQDLFQEVQLAAVAEGKYSEEAFFDYVSEILIEAGDLEYADKAQYQAVRGIRIDGYGGDPLNADGVLSLIVTDFNQAEEIATLTSSSMEAIFKRATNFLLKALDPVFRDSLEETTPAFGLADLISARWSRIEKVRFFLISNRKLSTRVDGRAAGQHEGRPLTYNVWDLGRLHRVVASGHGREEIEIDLVNDFGGELLALPASQNQEGCQTFLTVISGEQLAAIYERWGARLLEQNVRVFLQARGNVNKGIRKTIENEPHMFFAYNNGITSTAESIDTECCGTTVRIRGLKNFQIVNGGQTTASIYAASKKSSGKLSEVFVQMKLSLVQPEKAIEIVPNISRYANSQNKINAADFFANHPFHIRMEDFSRRVIAPSPDGSFLQSHWFYERARGQYNDAKAYLSSAEKRKFDGKFPKSQRFSKTDLAKFLNVWNAVPHIVSKGAQKNFSHFASLIAKEWEVKEDSFNEGFYREAVAKAIIFRETEKLVQQQPWYQGGYRANIVAYAISKLAYDVQQMGKDVDFQKTWQDQSVPEELKQALVVSAEVVNSVITEPPDGMRNVTEWAKQPACWKRVEEYKINWPSCFLGSLISITEKKETEREAVKEQKEINAIVAQKVVFEAGSDFWFQVKDWGLNRRLLSPKELGILNTAISMPTKIPSDKQSLILIETLIRLQEEGLSLGKEIVEKEIFCTSC